MLNEAVTWGIMLITIIVQVFIFYKYLPNLIQQVINDTTEQIQELFINPKVSKAFGILGKRSGEVRAKEATVNKFNDNVGKLSPVVGMLARQLDMEPTELLSLWTDPTIGPMIQGFAGPMVNKFLNPQAKNQPQNTSKGELGVIG